MGFYGGFFCLYELIFYRFVFPAAIPPGSCFKNIPEGMFLKEGMWRKAVKHRERKEERKRLMQWCQTVPLVFSINSADQGWVCSLHTHTHRHILTSHTHHAESLWLAGPQLSKSTFSLSLLFPSVGGHSSPHLCLFILWLCVSVCEPVSVFSGWDAESQSWPSAFRTHSPLCFSPHFFPFFSSWLKKSRTYLHTGTDPDLDVFISKWRDWAYRRWAAVFSLSRFEYLLWVKVYTVNWLLWAAVQAEISHWSPVGSQRDSRPQNNECKQCPCHFVGAVTWKREREKNLRKEMCVCRVKNERLTFRMNV